MASRSWKPWKNRVPDVMGGLSTLVEMAASSARVIVWPKITEENAEHYPDGYRPEYTLAAEALGVRAIEVSISPPDDPMDEDEG